MKIIASDYDGTLHYRHGIAQQVRDAIVKWQSVGNKFGIVSGRGIQNILSMVKREAIVCDFLIANNGAVIADGEGKVMKYHTADPALAGAISRFLLDHQCSYSCVVDLEGEIFLCTREDKENRRREDDRFVAFDDFDQKIAFTQISTVCPDSASAGVLTDELNQAFGEKVTAFQNGTSIDIVPLGVNKAKGIDELIALYGAAHDDVATVGDNKNDIAMLEAFRSYAVANAVDCVKQIAGAVVLDIAELVERELEK